jgi:hydroxymethylpyrimidine kinase/phosphomethylpyrimidine kinase
MIATSGDRLLDDEAIEAMKAELFGRALTITPNIPEAEALTGIQIRDDESRRDAARALAALGAATVVIKGGHYPTADVRDLLFDGHTFREFIGERVHGSTHGTGCTFAAALTSHLALGRSLTDAIPLAQRYVAGAIRHAPRLGKGQGPVEHFWELH